MRDDDACYKSRVPEVHIRGDGVELQLSVDGYERERVGESYARS